MKEVKKLIEWKETVYPVLISKKEEFHLLGYDTATTEEIWDCLLAKLERRKTEYQLHQFVDEIFKLSLNEYMNWLTISAVTTTNIDLLDEENRILFGK